MGPIGPAEAVGACDPVVHHYRHLFAHRDWRVVSDRDPVRPRPGPLGHPRSASVKALVVKLCEGKRDITALRRFLRDHPLLVLELGFRPVLATDQPFGFDVDQTVPGDRWPRHQQQTLDPAMLTALLAGTVRAVQAQGPDLGETVAVEVTHWYAWVAATNPGAASAQAHDPQRQPAGDPDCRLGAKRRANGKGAQVKAFPWGYGWGVAATTHPRGGAVVLAEVIQPFNHQDVTVFHPGYAQTGTHLGRPPTNRAVDAAFDAWHVDQTCATTGGIAAIPRNDRHPAPPRPADGIPICAAGLAMTPGREFDHDRGVRARDHHCPLLRPCRTGEFCDQPPFASGGCHNVINREPGGLMRATRDRTSEAYRAVYRQRICVARIYAQAKARGLDRPKVRRIAGVRGLATLTAIVINLGVLTRLAAHAATPQEPALC